MINNSINNEYKQNGAEVKNSSLLQKKEIEFYGHCASLTLDDIDGSIQLDREVKYIKIDYPKCEVVEIMPVTDLKGLIGEFIKYFQTWGKDESYQRCHWVNDYWIEGIILKDDCAIIVVGS